MDLTPTILAVSNAQIPEGLQFDGVDFSKVLFGGTDFTDRTLFWRYRNQRAARRNQWKLVITGSDTALYDLGQDLEETTDLSDSSRNVVESLARQLEAWESDVGKDVEMKTL
jgi:arylsulfatase A-like enzyme